MPPIQDSAYKMLPFTRHVLNFFNEVPALGILIILIGFDVMTGFIAAFITKKLSSKISYKGMAKKAFTLCIIGVGYVLDLLIKQLGGNDLHLAKFACLFFIGHELLSIIENAARAGVPMPPAFKQALLIINKMAGGTEDAKPLVIERERTHTERVYMKGPAPDHAEDAKPAKVEIVNKAENPVLTSSPSDRRAAENEKTK